MMVAEFVEPPAERRPAGVRPADAKYLLRPQGAFDAGIRRRANLWEESLHEWPAMPVHLLLEVLVRYFFKDPPLVRITKLIDPAWIDGADSKTCEGSDFWSADGDFIRADDQQTVGRNHLDRL